MRIAKATFQFRKIVQVFEFLSPMAMMCSINSQAGGPLQVCIIIMVRYEGIAGSRTGNAKDQKSGDGPIHTTSTDLNCGLPDQQLQGS